MKTKILIGAIVIVIVAIAAVFLMGTRGTSSQQAAPAPTTADLEGKSFRLASFNGAAVPQDATYTLSFKDGRLNAKFCNSMSGSYSLTGGVIKGMLASTMMYCNAPAGVMDAESGFGTMFDDGAAVALQGNTLTLSGDGKNFVFVAAQ